MPDSFDDRFSGLPVDAPSTPVISDIVGNTQIASPQFNLVPVDYDPFPKRRKGPAAWNDEPPKEMIRPEAPIADKAFGLNGKERYQFFPERLARSVYDIMSGQVAPYNPSTGEYNVEGAMDVAGLLGGAPLGIKPGAASVASGATRKMANELKMTPIDHNPFDPLQLYRGEYSGNKGGKFWSGDPEFARQFTQSGQESELLKRIIDKNHIYKPKEPVYAGDPDAIDKVVATAKAKGFKAVELNEGHNQPNSVYVFDKAALRSDTQKPGLAIAGLKEPAKPFFSAVEKAVTDISQPKMTGQQWLGTLSNKPGVKPEELDWIGLKDYLKENADKVVTKQEIESHVAANKVELKDVDKGKSQVFDVHYKDTLPNRLQQMPRSVLDEINTVEDVALARRLNPNFRETIKDKTDQETVDLIKQAKEVPNLDNVTKSYDTRQQAEEAVKQAAAENHLDIKPIDVHNETKYQSYQLPGGENYREKLLTLPAKPISTKGWSAEHDPNGYKNDWLIKNENGETVAVRTGNTAEEALNAATKNLDGQIKDTYKSAHWDEPNVLAHVRMNDRTIEGKKSLHIEEIQSDWHQAGRQHGYASDTSKLRNDIEKRFENGQLTQEEYQTELRHLGGPGGQVGAIPDAPFKKTWHELALKRMLREAAEKGYDRLSWTPGEAQAARYDLSKQVQDIGWNKSLTSDHSIVRINPIDGKTIALQIDKSGKVVESHPRSQASQFEGKNLSDVVGKELAEKILNKETGELKNTDLKIGGEGMKGFYDQITPKALEKIGKEHGVKVKQSGIDIPGGIGQWKYTGPERSIEELSKLYQSQKLSVSLKSQLSDVLAKMGAGTPYGKALENHGSYALAEALGGELKPVVKQQPIHYIDIPQSLKDQAMHKGFPLFSGGFMLNPVDHDPFSKEKK